MFCTKKISEFVMKKLIAALIFTVSILSVTAEEVYKIPLWEDYCPKKFVDAKVVTVEEYQQMQRFKFVPPLPKQVKNYNKAVEYWNERKMKFDKFVQVCSNFPEDKKQACYERIDERETKLNDALEELRKKQLKDTGDTTTPASIYMDSTNPLRNMMMRGY